MPGGVFDLSSDEDDDLGLTLGFQPPATQLASILSQLGQLEATGAAPSKATLEALRRLVPALEAQEKAVQGGVAAENERLAVTCRELEQANTVLCEQSAGLEREIAAALDAGAPASEAEVSPPLPPTRASHTHTLPIEWTQATSNTRTRTRATRIPFPNLFAPRPCTDTACCRWWTPLQPEPEPESALPH